MADERARDIVDQLTPRDACGGTLTERIGRRGWERPRVSVSPRIYRLYRVPDPWDPNAPTSDESVGLGPVALRLGEQKRQPAPHLQPKQPKAKPKSLAEQAKDQAREGRGPTKRAATSTASEASPAASRSASDPVREDDPTEEDRLAEIAAERRRQAELARPRPKRSSEPAPASASGGDPGLRAPLPVRPDREVAEPGDDGAAAPRPATVRSQAGRFRMKPVQTVAAPTVRATNAPENVAPVEREETRPVERVAPPSPGGGGLDDLFGSAMRQGRLSLASRPDEDEDEDGDED